MMLKMTDLHNHIFTAGHAPNEESRLFFDSSYQDFWVAIMDSKPCQGIVAFWQ